MNRDDPNPLAGNGWERHRSTIFAVLGFALVVWVALTLTAPTSGQPIRRPPGAPAATTEVTTPQCPASAPNPASGCMIITAPR
jgi:hypothetical protein